MEVRDVRTDILSYFFHKLSAALGGLRGAGFATGASGGASGQSIGCGKPRPARVINVGAE
jgi:hypothetical protein